MSAPALDHDAMMLERFGRRVTATGRLERRIAAALLDHVQAKGFTLVGVDDGDEVTAATSTKAAMELIFNLDEARVVVANAAGTRHVILLVLGNGEDIISDWNYGTGDPDGFNAAMDAFDVEAVS